MSADPPADAPLSVEQARRVVVFGYDAEFAENVTAFEAAVRAEEQAIAAAAVTEAEACYGQILESAFATIRAGMEWHNGDDWMGAHGAIVGAIHQAWADAQKALALAAGSGSTP